MNDNDLQRDELGLAVMDALDGQPIVTGMATLGRVLIHLCLTSDYPKDAMLESLAEQWDIYEKKYLEIRAQEARDKLN